MVRSPGISTVEGGAHQLRRHHQRGGGDTRDRAEHSRINEACQARECGEVARSFIVWE